MLIKGAYSYLPSLDKLLSPDFSEIAIQRIIKQKFREDIDSSGIDMTDFYRGVAASIREGVREIIARLKKNGDAEGFNRRLKAVLDESEGVSDLNYEAFKLKMHYAMVVTDPNHPLSETEAEKYTLDYTAYRNWKFNLTDSFSALCSVRFDQTLPDAPFPTATPDMNIAKKGFRKFRTKIGSLWHSSHHAKVSTAHEDKNRIRGIRADIDQLRTEIVQLQQQVRSNVTDRSAKKAYFEAAVFLITLDMMELSEMIGDCLSLANGIPTNRCTGLYIKHIRKHSNSAKAQIQTVLSQYNTYCARLAGNNTFTIIQEMNKVKADLTQACQDLQLLGN